LWTSDHRPRNEEEDEDDEEEEMNDERDSDSTEYVDILWDVRPMINAFNKHTQSIFKPSWLVCIDESMVKWTNKKGPAFCFVNRKPTSEGNEYHTACCAETHIMFHIDMVEGKDKPQRNLAQSHLLERMTETIKGSYRVVCLDSGFGVVKPVLNLLERNIYATGVFKKRKYYPRSVPGDAIQMHMNGQPIGNIESKIGFDSNDKRMRLFCIREDTYVSTMGVTWEEYKLKEETDLGRKMMDHTCLSNTHTSSTLIAVDVTLLMTTTTSDKDP